MNETYTAPFFPSMTLWICACCYDHTDAPLVFGEPVECRVCGLPCSCEGCVAEQ